jgi:putative ABC transport system permease protein
MFKNYLKVAIRNIIRQKGHSFINIIGLSVGMAICLLLFLWIMDEVSYDRYHEKADRIYRVVEQNIDERGVFILASTPAPLGPSLVREFPWIQKAVRFSRSKDVLIQYQDKLFRETIFFADPGVFDVFTFPMVTGDPKTVLKDPYSILISEDMKEKYFGNENPIGKTITLYKRREFKVTGVLKNIPRSSHFRFHFLTSILSYRKDYLNKWWVSNYYTYILIAKDSPLDSFKERMPQFVEKYMGKKAWDLHKRNYFLQPLTDIHLHSKLRNEIEKNRDISTVYIFTAIALFILLVACLNYINLATARFSNRAKEVGLRKVLGATSAQLIRQFLGESLLFAVISLPLAVLLAEILLPVFNSLSGKTLAFQYFDNLFLLAVMGGIVLIVGLISGLVPALFISAFHAASAIKGMLKVSSTVSILRRCLVVFQFSVTIIFIIGALIISDQLHYMNKHELGLKKENIINIHLKDNEEALLKYEILKHEFLQHPDITAASASDFMPGRPHWNNNFWYEGIDNQNLLIGCIPVDFDFLDTFQINMVEGRGFSRNFPTDEKNAFIINESAVKEFGWQPGSAVGKAFNISHGWKKGTIIGVVQDFHFNSLHKEIEPVVLFIEPQSFAYISVRIKPGHISQTLAFLKNKWQEIIPGQTFVYSFLDDDFDKLYKIEFRLQKIFTLISILTIFIACLGLFGLASFAVEQRTKEIGIRKVYGASVPGIVLLLSREFTLLVLAANIFAWPIAWYAMNKWLQNFSFRITILPWTFLLAALVAIVIALMTVSYKAVRAAVTNPVETLRYE